MDIDMNFRRKQHAFSLIELLIALAIAAIVASVALPAYNGYMRRAKTQEAFKILSDARIRLEQWAQDNNGSYTGFLNANCTPVNPATTSVVAEAQYFTYACTFPTATTFTITATGRADRDMVGYQYTITDTNAKTSALPGGGGSATQWVSK
jgi:type IV pilus assembly protein PilE